MRYKSIVPGAFISRPNRFVAKVEAEGEVQTVHVKNTGRCRELLIPGVRVYLERAENPNRATQYDLVAVEKGKRLINMDSQAPNKVFGEYLRSGAYIPDISLVRHEMRWGSSRFDFYAEAGSRKIFLEVKGVTLEENGVVLFPDAPTERGVKHLRELASCISEGYEAHAVFVVQMKDVKYFTPNRRTHPAFAEALAEAEAAGVRLTALDCEVTPDSLSIRGEVPIKL
ncbi:MAG: DNA/RNA nuclease SfsA [Candidatus Heteroscillospira sp.]